jgi:hypothetical protein
VVENLSPQKRPRNAAVQQNASPQHEPPAPNAEAPALAVESTNGMAGSDSAVRASNVKTSLPEAASELVAEQPENLLTVSSFLRRGAALFLDCTSLDFDHLKASAEPPLMFSATNEHLVLLSDSVERLLAEYGDRIPKCSGRKEILLGYLAADATRASLPTRAEAGRRGKCMLAQASSVKASAKKCYRAAADRARAIERAMGTLVADDVATRLALSTMQLLTDLTELNSTPYNPPAPKIKAPAPKRSVLAPPATPAPRCQSLPAAAAPAVPSHEEAVAEAADDDCSGRWQLISKRLQSFTMWKSGMEYGKRRERSDWEWWRNQRTAPEQPSIAEYDALEDKTRELKAQIFELQSCAEQLHFQWEVAASTAWEYGWRPSHVRYDAEGFELCGLDDMMRVKHIFYDRDLARMREHLSVLPSRLPIFRGLPEQQEKRDASDGD